MVDVFVTGRHTHDVFAVCADVIAKLWRDAAQGFGHLAAAEEQFHRPEGTGSEDHISGVYGLFSSKGICGGFENDIITRVFFPHPLSLSHWVRGWGEGSNINNCHFRDDLRAVLLRKIEIIFRKRVFRVITATDHATAAMIASGACGSFPAQEWIGDNLLLLPRFAKEHADIRRTECAAFAEFLRDLFHLLVSKP